MGRRKLPENKRLSKVVSYRTREGEENVLEVKKVVKKIINLEPKELRKINQKIEKWLP